METFVCVILILMSIQIPRGQAINLQRIICWSSSFIIQCVQCVTVKNLIKLGNSGILVTMRQTHQPTHVGGCSLLFRHLTHSSE